jgi:ABC-type polysaccharide/polyol phosphate transport system ATPase subunit
MLPKGTIQSAHIWKRFRRDRKSVISAGLERVRDRRHPADDRWRWALRDIDFTASPSESIGLVGANGSGKSTLLKILTRVMYPYAGAVNVSGRVGALIEVSSGIHPQLSGRENVYLYGSLLGLKRRDVARRFDDIVEFAEVGPAIDRLVKYYSSGMKMRLGFSVAAFLEPDVLLVDEVLAVGDAAFQQRCLDRMRDVLAQGTTLVFVSHDLGAVEATCSRGLWLSNGVVRADGEITETLAAYRRDVEQAAEIGPASSGPVTLRKVQIEGPEGKTPTTQGPLTVTTVFESEEPRVVRLYLGFSEGTSALIFLLHREWEIGAGETEVRCTIDHLPLPRGRYYLWLNLFRKGDLIPWRPVAHFDVTGPLLDRAPRAVIRLSPVHVDARWEVEAT